MNFVVQGGCQGAPSGGLEETIGEEMSFNKQHLFSKWDPTITAIYAQLGAMEVKQQGLSGLTIYPTISRSEVRKTCSSLEDTHVLGIWNYKVWD